MNKEQKLREKVLKSSRIYYQKKEKVKFREGKTYLPASGKFLDEEDLVNLIDCSLDMWLTSGRYEKKFNNELARFLGVKYCALTNSGSSANLIAISALTSYKLRERRLKPGDEVITVAAGFPTTITPILQNRLIPVFLDIEIGTYNIKIDELEKGISKKTKAIFLAHSLGNPFNLGKVMKMAELHNLWVIEDNCDSLGSKYKGKYTGTFGDISTCSFYPAHHITTGEGGAVLTKNHKLYKIIKSFRDWGRDCWCETGYDNTCGKRFSQQQGELPFGYDHKYIYSHLGYNLKVTDMQAAIGVSQIKKLPSFIKKRKENYKMLFNGLKELQKYLILPIVDKNSEPSWFGFPITLRKNVSFSRHKLITYLESHKIGTRLLFAGNILKQPAFLKKEIEYKIIGSLKNTDINIERTFWIGLWPGLNEKSINYIIKHFKLFINNISK